MSDKASRTYKEFSFPVGDFSVVFFSDSGISNRGEYSSEPHQHDFNEVICISEGHASIFFDGESYPLDSGDVVLIPDGTEHSFSTQSNTYYTIISFWQDANKTSSSPIGSLTEKKEIRIFKKFKALPTFGRVLDYYYGSYNYKTELISACLCEIVVMMLEESAQKKPAASDVTLESNNYRSYLIGQYFCERFNSDPTLEELAEILHLSVQQTGRIIKKTYGRSFRDQIVQLKLNHAKHLLKNTDMPINEISASLGYTLPHAFFTLFKSETGTTPSQYRKNHK